MKIRTRPNAVNTRNLVTVVAPLLLGACGGGGCAQVHGHPGLCAFTYPAPTYTVFGYVAGLTGSGLTLSYNGGTPVAINGAITLASNVASGTAYSVAIASQPTNPAQTCTISNPSGTVGTFDVSVLVYCPRRVGAWAFVAAAGSITTTPGVGSVPGSLSTYAIDAGSGALVLVPGSTVPTGPAVATVQLVPHAPYVWALSIGDASATDNNTVSSLYVYTVDANNGLLTANAGNPIFTLNGTSATPAACNGVGGQGSTIAVTFAPSGTFGYDLLEPNLAGKNAGTYVFNLSAGLPQWSGLAVSNDCDTPTVVDPSGQFAYYGMLFLGVDTLIANTVNPTTGGLTELPGYGPPVMIQWGPGPAEPDPFGRFLYSIDGQLIDGRGIDPFNGGVGGIAGLPITPSAGSMISLLISPDGQFAYLIASDGLYTYSVDSFGALHSVALPVQLQIAAGQTHSAPGVTTSSQIDPSGQFLYVSASAGSGQQGIYAYRRDASTGALTLVPGSPFAVTGQTVPLQLALY